MRAWILHRQALAYSQGLAEVTVLAEGFLSTGSPWDEALAEAGQIMMVVWAAEVVARTGEDLAG